MKRVGIISTSGDAEAGFVAEALSKRGARPVLIASDRVPDLSTLTWVDGEVSFDGVRIDDLPVVYVRRVHLSLPVPSLEDLAQRNFEDWGEQYVAERERHSFLTSVFRTLSRGAGHFVNPLESFDRHFLKTEQVGLLSRAGVPVPSTLATCDPEAVRRFAAQHDEVIYKPLAAGAHVCRLEKEDLGEDRLQLLRNCPALFQERILGDEYRAYVLAGEPVVAFRIPTEGVVDAREALDRSEKAELPPEVWNIVTRAAKALGLVFTAADLRVDESGKPFVLELNPTPAISFFDDPKDGVIVSRLAEYLLAHA